MTQQDNVCTFEELGECFYEHVEFRAPKKGEWYLSGAIPVAWKAPSDLTTPYKVVRATHEAVTARRYVRGARVR